MIGVFFLWSIFLAGIIARSNAQGDIGNNEVLIASKVEIKVNSVLKKLIDWNIVIQIGILTSITHSFLL